MTTTVQDHLYERDFAPVPFLAAHYQGIGYSDRDWNWRTRYEGVFRLVENGRPSVVRWHCPHLHRTAQAAQACAQAEYRRRFGDAGRCRGMLSDLYSQPHMKLRRAGLGRDSDTTNSVEGVE